MPSGNCVNVTFLTLWIKKCPKCNCYHVRKWGIKRGKQNYKCKLCKHSFQNRNRTLRSHNISDVYFRYASGRQTLLSLCKELKISIKTLRKRLDDHSPATGEIIVPEKPVNLIIDATFFSRRDGVLVARANSRNLAWKEIETEKIDHYEELLTLLFDAGIRFSSLVIDGKRGVLHMLLKKFPGIPIQLCQFHQIQIVTRYLSKRPKLEAGKELRQISLVLTKVDRKSFSTRLKEWHEKWGGFLSEKTRNPETKRWHYTHRRLRSAYRSLNTNLPYLFTYMDFPEVNMPNTTNSCDGSFAHWKGRLGVHRGLKKRRRTKMMNYLLENC